jgi:hypothetical protein
MLEHIDNLVYLLHWCKLLLWTTHTITYINLDL